MLKLKPEGDPIKYMDICKKLEGIDGPAYAYAESEDGKKYVYTTYATGVKDVDRTSAEIALWALVHDTLKDRLRCSGLADPIILWRRRPEFHKDDTPDEWGGRGGYIISMRCVIVPRGEKFLPVVRGKSGELAYAGV